MSPSRVPTLRLKVVSPTLLLVDADVEEIQIPTIDGLIGVMPGHRPLIVAIGRGPLSYRQGSESDSFPVEGGTAEIQPDRVLVFTRSE